MSARIRALRLGVPVALGLLAAWNAAAFFPVTVDDAFISLRYAWNLAHGQGLVFNPGERVEGFSNPTWTLWAAACYALGWEAIAALKWTGIGCAALTTLLVGRSLVREGEGVLVWAAAGIGGLLCALDLNLAFWAPNGLETPLWTLLLTAFALVLERRWTEGERVPWSAALGVFLYATRPEAPLFLAAAGAWELARPAGAEGRRGRWSWFAVLGVGVAAALGARLAYYGDVVANTWYVKAAEGWRLDLFPGSVASQWGVTSPVTGALLLLLLPRLLADRRSWPWIGVVVVQFVFVARAGADWMAQNRFWVPIVPAAAVLVGRGLAARVPAWALGLAGVAVLGQLWVHTTRELRYLPGLKEAMVESPRKSQRSWPATLHGAWQTGVPDRVVGVLGVLPEGASLAISEIGLVGFVGDLHIVDAFGLVDRRLGGATHEKLADVLATMDPPDFILMRAGVPVLDAMKRAPWYTEGTWHEVGRWGNVWLEAPGSVAAPIPPLPAELRWARFSTAVARVPGEPRFHEARLAAAKELGDPARVQLACEERQAAMSGLDLPCAGAPGKAAAPGATAAGSPAAGSPGPGVAGSPGSAAAGSPGAASAAAGDVPANGAGAWPASLVVGTTNGGFEQGDGAAIPGWTPVPGDGVGFGRTQEAAAAGEAGLRVEKVVWVCSQWAPVQGELYARGKLRIRDVPAAANPRQGAAVSFRLRRADGTQEYPTVQAWTGTSDWQDFSVRFPGAGFEAWRFCVGLNNATGTADFDELEAGSG